MAYNTFKSRNNMLGKRGLLTTWVEQTRIRIALPYLNKKVLDFGCGARAPLAEHFNDTEYLGVDIQRRAVAAALERHPTKKFLITDDMDNGDGIFNSISCLAVLEHVSDTHAFLVRLNSLLAMHGTIVVTTPQPITDQLHYLGGRLGFLSPTASKEHERLLSAVELHNEFGLAGFRISTYKTFLFGTNQLVVATKVF